MIFKKIYMSYDHYVVEIENNKHIKISCSAKTILFEKINKLINSELEELSDAFVMYEFPCKFVKISNKIIKIDFLGTINSYVLFELKNNKLECIIKIDNTIVSKHSVHNKDPKNILIKIFDITTDDIEKLTYIDDIEIYNYIDKGYNYVLIVVPNYKINTIKGILRNEKWNFKIDN